MAVKGFKAARAKVIADLTSGNYRHDDRGGSKNYLADGLIDVAEVVALLLVCRGNQYAAAPHHSKPCDVHIFKPIQGGRWWYVKVYFASDIEPLAEGQADTIFISIHPSQEG